jgi:HTH-type transcriptional regulator/antitoxin HipB
MQNHVRTVSDIALLVRKKRLAKGLSQEHAAGLAGVGRRFLSELESGEKETLEIGKVLQVLNRLGVKLVLEIRDDEKK